MAHGVPDWGITSGAETVYMVEDLGEAVVRLGSPVSFDRRGDVVWWDDFEWGLEKWSAEAVGTGGSVGISTERARNGRCSAHLVAGSDNTHLAGIHHDEPYPSSSAFGFESSICFPADVESIEWSMVLFAPTGILSTRLYYHIPTQQLRYEDSAAALAVLASGVDLQGADRTFHTVKLVVDLRTNEYVRAIVNETTYAMAGIPCSVVGVSLVGRLHVGVTFTGTAGQNDECWVDDAIITQNEPI